MLIFLMVPWVGLQCVIVVFADHNDFLFQNFLSEHETAKSSKITPFNTINKPLVVYRFSGNVMTSITPLDI